MNTQTQPERDGYEIVKCWNGTPAGSPMHAGQSARYLLDYSLWTPTTRLLSAPGRDFARRTPAARQQA